MNNVSEYDRKKLTHKAMCQVNDGIKNVQLFNMELELMKAKIEYEKSLKKLKSNPFMD